MIKYTEKGWKTQYKQYIETWKKLEAAQPMKTLPGGRPLKPLTFEQFKQEVEYFSNSGEKFDKYTIGKEIAKSSTKYTKRQLQVARDRLKNAINKMDPRNIDLPEYQRLKQLMKGHFTTEGKVYQDYFYKNATEFMELGFMLFDREHFIET